MITLLWAAGSLLLSLGALFVVLRCLFWLICRLEAERCPECDAKWATECMGEWAGDEDWQCHRCGHWWSVRV